MAKRIKNQYSPDVVSLPGETLQGTLDALGMTQAELAERTGRPRKTINEIIKGKTAITHETALQLERVLGVPASFWNNRELQYREFLARQQDSEHLSRWDEWLKEFPLSTMAKRGWIRKHSGKVDQIRELLQFFGIASPAQWESTCAVAYRKSARSKVHSLSVWLRRGQLEGQSMECAAFDVEKFKEVLDRARAWTRLSSAEFVPRLVKECADAGVAVVFVPELPGSSVSGATRWLAPARVLLQLSLRYKSNDQLWFTFFHEAGHVLYDSRSTLVRLEGVNSERDEHEAKADEFASEHLVPSRALTSFLKRYSGNLSGASVERFANEIGIAPGIVVGRLQHDGRIPFSHLNHLKVPLTWKKPG